MKAFYCVHAWSLIETFYPEGLLTIMLWQAVYEHHPQPKKLIVENDLPQKLQSLIEERRDGQSSGGQGLVKQMATSLLKALHINTVL